MNDSASLNALGMASWEKFQEQGCPTLVKTKPMLSTRDFGKIADRVDSAYSVPTQIRGTVPLARTRTAVTVSMCLWISVIIFLLWSSSCSIPRVSANPGVSRMRTFGKGYIY